MFLRRNRLVTLLAAFTVVLQALWPLLSHARPKDPSLLVPVCTVNGITHYLDLNTGETPLDERSASHGEHCKLCVVGDGKVVVVSLPDISAFLLTGNSSNRTAVGAAPLRASPHLLSAQPRAPPAVS